MQYKFDEEAAIAAYCHVGLPLDRLPYTEEFELMHKDYVSKAGNIQRHDLWGHLAALRKSKKLPTQKSPSDHANGNAFTLVEILVVVVVLGILAAIVTPKFVSAQHEAAITATSEDLQAIENALSMYYAKYGEYPRDVNRKRVVTVLDPFFKSENPFAKPAPIGGIYDYEGPPNWNPVQISIRSEPTEKHSQKTATELDEYMDNGDLNTGSIRRQGNRTYYIVGK